MATERTVARAILTVDADRCIHCAACAVLAPGVFRAERTGTHVLRGPQDADERSAVMAARWNCPVSAIAYRED